MLLFEKSIIKSEDFVRPSKTEIDEEETDFPIKKGEACDSRIKV